MIRDFIRRRSINLGLVMTGGCNGCDIEIVALLSQRYDLEQYGIFTITTHVNVTLFWLQEQWRNNGRRSWWSYIIKYLNQRLWLLLVPVP